MLDFALENGIIDEAYIQAQMEDMKRKELLAKHPYKVWEGKDGKWYTYIFDKDRGRRVLKKRSSRKTMEDFLVGLMKEEEYNPTIRDVFEEWNDRRRDLKKICGSTYMRYMRDFDRFYKDFGENKIKSVTPEEFIDFLEEQVPKYDLSAKAFSNLKTITRGMLKRAKRRKLIDWNVEDVMYNLDVSERDFRKVIKEDYEEVFSDDEMNLIVNYLKNHKDTLNLGILLMFATGMRVGELMALKPSDIIDWNAVQIRRTETCQMGEDGKYERTVKDYPKTEAGVRTIVIPDKFAWVTKAVKYNNPFGEYLFEFNGQRMAVRTMEKRLKKICDELGIYPKSPHKIRKTYGSILLDNHVDKRTILDQMGHTSLLTTEKSYHRNRKKIDKKLSILNDLPEFRTSDYLRAKR